MLRRGGHTSAFLDPQRIYKQKLAYIKSLWLDRGPAEVFAACTEFLLCLSPKLVKIYIWPQRGQALLADFYLRSGVLLLLSVFSNLSFNL